MRKGLIGVALLALPAFARAQVPSDTSTASYEINGLTVIHHRRPATVSVFAAHLYLLGGSRQVTAATAGIEPFLIMASEYGTRRYPGDATRRALARTGGGIAVSAGMDWTTYSLHGLKQEFDSAWAVFAERLLYPTLDSTAMAIIRARLMTNVARRNASPEDLAYFLADSLAYRDHPYAVNPRGNAVSLATLTGDDLRAYARDQLVTSRMLLVVVGDIEPEHLRKAVTATLGALSRGAYVWTVPPAVKLAKPELVAVGRPTQTNYVLGYMNGPSRGSSDYVAFERATYLLSSLVSEVVREQSTLSYSARVDLIDRGASGAAFYVSTTRPDSALALFDRVLTLLSEYDRDVTIPRHVLRKSAESYNTAYVFATESASSHADLMARAHLYQGDYQLASRQAELAARLAFPDLRKALRTYARNIQYVYVGDTNRFTPDKVKKR